MSGNLQREIPAAAVVIVNYFKAARLLDGLRSLARQTASRNSVVVVVDNSIDAEERETLQRAAQDRSFALVDSVTNIGYTRGCNLGVQSLPLTRYVVLCNPDIVWDEADSLETLIAIADADPSVGVLAPLQLDDDGAMVETARTFPTLLEQVGRRLRPETGSEIHITEPLGDSVHTIEVDWVQSSCVLIRRSLWDRVGGLDQKYFLFMADVELGRATWDAGLRVCVTSAARVRADGKRASSGGFLALLTSRSQRSHLKDAIRYYLTNGFRKLHRGQRSASYLSRDFCGECPTVADCDQASRSTSALADAIGLNR